MAEEVKGEVIYEIRADDSHLESDLDISQKKVEQSVEKGADRREQIEKEVSKTVKREKEKVTIFTRNAIVNKEIRILKSLLTQCMHAYELMHTGKVTVLEYDITVEFPKFADDSYDNKLAVLGKAFGDGIISPEMLVSRLYDNEELSEEDKQREIDYIKENNKEPFEEGFPEEGDEAVLNGTDEYYEDENSFDL